MPENDFWRYHPPLSFEKKMKYLDDKIAEVYALMKNGANCWHILRHYTDERSRLAATIGKRRK